MAELALAKKQSVVIDNTNLDKESRQRYFKKIRRSIDDDFPVMFVYRYIDLAKIHKVPCRCFLMNVSIEHAKHNNTVSSRSG